MTTYQMRTKSSGQRSSLGSTTSAHPLICLTKEWACGPCGPCVVYMLGSTVLRASTSADAASAPTPPAIVAALGPRIDLYSAPDRNPAHPTHARIPHTLSSQS